MEQKHWLVRSKNIRLLWRAFIAVLVVTVLIEPLVAHEGHFGIDGTFGFNAWYGFAACAALILLSKGLGFFLRRRDTYYDD